MIYRNGTAASFPVEFSSSDPEGNIAWALYDETGVELTSGMITPQVGDVSTLIVVPSEFNTLGTGVLAGFRDLSWSYMVDGEVINGEVRYAVESRVPYGASVEGVRTKLGVAPHELPDGEVSLARSYYNFLTLAEDQDLSLFSPSPAERLRLADAIEALAALEVIPTLQVRLAIKESSGTDTFQRQPMDWTLIAERLRALVNDGVVILLPGFDPMAGFGAIFMLARPDADPLTGTTN